MSKYSTAYTQALSQIFSVIIGRSIDLGRLNENVEKSNKTIETKIIEAQESLTHTAQVINELNELIDSNQKELERVRSEYEHINKLNKVSLEEVEPFLTELDNTLRSSSKRNHIISFFISLLFFLMGAIFGPIIYNFFVNLF